ncbi:hypothetical protein Hdeb2414_s0585g00919981 [Helianthus debilis subsp. tardiflorus]
MFWKENLCVGVLLVLNHMTYDSMSFCRGSSWRFPGGFWSFARNRVLACPSYFLACVSAFSF